MNNTNENQSLDQLESDLIVQFEAKIAKLQSDNISGVNDTEISLLEGVISDVKHNQQIRWNT
jgi:hypothetical protein